MSRTITLFIVLAAAILEAGGDAVIRMGLHTHGSRSRYLFLGGGAILLFAYGCVLNAPPWDFGKLIGIYIVLFFLVAECISVLVLKERPPTAVYVGGSLIVTGGLVVLFGNR